MKKTTSLLLALLIAGLAPGPAAYAGAGKTIAGNRTGSSPKIVRIVPAGSSGFQVSGPASIDSKVLSPGTAASDAEILKGLSGAVRTGTDPGASLPVQGAKPSLISGGSQDPAKGVAEGEKDPGASSPGQESAAQGNGQDEVRSPEAEKAQADKIFESVRGKTLLLVGTSKSRPFILEETKRVADKLGLKLVLLDKPEAREQSLGVIPDSHFIPAPIASHDQADMEAIVEKVAQYAQGARIHAVLSLLNPYVELAGKIVDRVGAAGNSGDATKAAHTKSIARERIMEAAPEVATPSRVVQSPEEARRAYRELGGGKFVMKPIHGGGSTLVVVNIASEESAERAWREIDSGLKAFAKRHRLA